MKKFLEYFSRLHKILQREQPHFELGRLPSIGIIWFRQYLRNGTMKYSNIECVKDSQVMILFGYTAVSSIDDLEPGHRGDPELYRLNALCLPQV